MDIKVKIKDELRCRYGNFNTYLENIYEDKITEVLINGDLNKKKEWLTYNQVVLEFKNSLKDMMKVKELQYKLTDSVNPNNVCVEVLNEVKTKTPELERLYYKILNFR